MTEDSFELYSSVHGGFEATWAPLNQGQSIQTWLLSDSSVSAKGWGRVVQVPRAQSPRLGNRFDKMLFGFADKSIKLTVYVDANVRPINNLAPLIEDFLQSGADLGLYRHYQRTSVSLEAQACLRRGKITDPNLLRKELEFYRQEGFADDEGMWEGSVILKNHTSPRIEEAMKEWWSLFSKYQTRDQFSLPFVIWKHRLRIFDLDQHSPGREFYFLRLQHSEKGIVNRLARTLQAKAPENQWWGFLHQIARRMKTFYKNV